MKRVIRASVTLLIFGWMMAPSAGASAHLFLGGDGTPVATLATSAPTADPLPDYDSGRDSLPGLLVVRGGAGIAETDPTRYQQWMTAPGTVTLDGPTSLEFWAAMREFGTGLRGVVNAFLMDCDATGADCTEIARGNRNIRNWSGDWGSWTRHSIGFGRITHTVSEGRSLALRVVVDSDSDDDMIFAYGTAEFLSRLTDGAANDTAIDCDFTDWTDGSGIEFVVSDQSGADDWSSPGKLDITIFAVSSNLVDAVHVLMGFDDAPVIGGVVSTLIDTDLDNNANFVMTATVDGMAATVELYGCDDSSTEGCPDATLLTTYPASQFCPGLAAGPWNTDTLVEAVLPFGDVGVTGGPVVLTSLASYAAASLLNSPKDSVLGSDGQDYVSGVYYDLSTGDARLTSGVGSGFVVRRSDDPATVRTAAPHADILTAPFDDLSGTLTDGQAYFYVVEKDGDVPVTLSAHANRYAGVIRLGFDDNDPWTAAVDSTESTVKVAEDSVPADGTRKAMVAIVPRDAHGEPIGTGCTIQLDAFALGPATLAGPVIDHHDGGYTVEIVSTSAAVARVEATVEGVGLQAQPTVSFNSP